MKNRKLLRAAAALLLVGIVGVASVGCSFELEQPNWVTQALCDHVFDEEEVLKEATCTEDGKIQKTCSDCGKTKITTVKATGHDVVEDEAVDATCTTPGLTAGSHCTACGEVLVKQEEVPAGHTYGEWTVDVEPTCTTEGSQSRVCSVCGETETEAIPAVSHVDATADGTCDVCGETVTEVLPMHEDLNQDCLCDNCFLVVTSPTELGYKETPYVEGTPVAGTWFRVYNIPTTDEYGIVFLTTSSGIRVKITSEIAPSYSDIFELTGSSGGPPVNMDMYNDNQDGYIDFYLPAKVYSVNDMTESVDIELKETDVFETITIPEGCSIYILEE